MKNVIIIGGGLSGMITSIQLARMGIPCTVLEKKSYPFHRVCGEYISNETVPFLRSLGLYPEQFAPAIITKLQLTSVNGKAAEMSLGLGGFGISRYVLDHYIYQKACDAGVNFITDTEAEKITFDGTQFVVTANGKFLTTDVVVGSFGKRSRIDISMNRHFIQKRSPYIGVKYHVVQNFDPSMISLHNFENGYCGFSSIEDGKANLCYLSHRDNLKKFGNIRKMEEALLFRNPFLKSIFENATFLFDKPETINEISFETKGPVENHILMTGDAAGMITPLCGNGMAMAIHSSKILGKLLIGFCLSQSSSRKDLESAYVKAWTQEFQKRLWFGRQVQRLFGSERASDFAVNIARSSPLVSRFLIDKTHGKPF